MTTGRINQVAIAEIDPCKALAGRGTATHGTSASRLSHTQPPHTQPKRKALVPSREGIVCGTQHSQLTIAMAQLNVTNAFR